MRRLGRQRARTEEDESVFVTMTDMTISFLLIIMILLAFFATQLSDDDTVARAVYDAVEQERDRLRINNGVLALRVRALEETVQPLKDALAAAEAELERLRARLLQLREASSPALQRERDQLRLENNRLRSRLSEIETATAGLRDALAASEAELQRLKERLLTLDADRVPMLQQERDTLREANDDLRQRVLELEAGNERLRSELVATTAELQRLRQRLEQLREANVLEVYLSEAIEQRRNLLLSLRDRLLIEFPDLDVVISPEQDALRFQGEGLFRSGSSELEPRQRQIVDSMGRLLDEILVCFTIGPRARRGGDCNSGNAVIEAVQIEGHTDSDGSDASNLRLSTDRSNQTLLVMLDNQPDILVHQNLRGQPVMSVSGYGEMRPIDTNATEQGKAANRRIDLRIIMYAPSTNEEVEEVGRRLDRLRDRGERP